MMASETKNERVVVYCPLTSRERRLLEAEAAALDMTLMELLEDAATIGIDELVERIAPEVTP